MNRFLHALIKGGLITSMCIFSLMMSSFGQAIGGRENNQPSPQDIKPSSLSKGAISNDVNLFDGSVTSGYSLGSVSTPSGLNFTLALNYNSTSTGGDNVPFVSGIPYGEGWNLNIPTINVSSETYHAFSESKYHTAITTNSQVTDPAHYLLPIDPDKEGRLCWFAPVISIPGVISERFILKYYETQDNEWVFVPHTFDHYVEARFNGQQWRIILEDGTTYNFAGAGLATMINAPNSRVFMSDLYDVNLALPNYEEDLFNLILPKKQMLAWYCTSINHPNYPAGQEILFSYSYFGEFNYYKEFYQPGMSDALSRFAKNTVANYLPDMVCAKDILLDSITSFAYGAEFEKIVLDYSSVQTPTSPWNMFSLSDNEVYRKDSMYSYKTVYSEGVNYGNTNCTECSMISESSEFDGADVGSENFTTWTKYKHGKSGSPAPGDWPSNIVSATNPYIVSEFNNQGKYLIEYADNEDDIQFDNSFLESRRLDPHSYLWPSGEIYEIRTLIRNDNFSGDGYPFCNFDVNIVSGSYHENEKNAATSGSNFASNIDLTKRTTVFSTFNQPVKWNSVTRTGSIVPPQQYLSTSNSFLMPNLPYEFHGFHIQVGPGNSDHNFELEENEVKTTDGYPSAYLAYFNHINTNATPAGDNGILDPTAPIPSNFGIGLPWHMLTSLYSYMDVDQNGWTEEQEERFRFWWNTNPSGSNEWDSRPTAADDKVKLCAVELIRNSRNPYMLTSVKHYKVNGELDNIDNAGYTVTKEFQFFYDVIVDDVQNNLTGIEAWDPHDRKHNIYVLKKIKEIPTNPSVYNASFTLDDQQLLTVQFDYSVLSTNSTNNILFNTHVVALSAITDQLGSKTVFTYYPLNDEATQVIVKSFITPFGVSASIPSQEYYMPATSVLEIHLALQEKKIKFSDNTSLDRKWTYGYEDPLVSEAVVSWANIDGNANTDDDHFHGGHLDDAVGFRTVTVHDPKVNSFSTATNYTVYEFFGNMNDEENENYFNNKMLFGKLKKVTNYDEQDHALKIHESSYEVIKAYWNARYRIDADNSIEVYDYNRTLNESNYSLINPNNYFSADFLWDQSAAKITATDHGALLLEVVCPSIFQLQHADYLNSYFIKKIQDKETEYSIESVGKSLIHSVTDIIDDATGAISSLRSVEKDAIECSSDPIPFKSIPLITITDYQYWDAEVDEINQATDYNVVPFDMMKINTAYDYLFFEPSWQLYSTTTYSPQQPGAYSKKEYFYYYDLKNYFGETPFEFDAVWVSQDCKMRNLVYEMRTTTKSCGLPAIRSSDYYWYDWKWNSDINFSLLPPEGIEINPPCNVDVDESDWVSEDLDIIEFDEETGVQPGYKLAFVNGEYVQIPFSTSTEFSQRTSSNEGGLHPVPLPNVGQWLAGKLFYREHVINVDTIISNVNSNSYDDEQEAKILRFREETFSQGNLSGVTYHPIFPFDTLLVDSVALRTQYGLVELRKDEKSLYTKYYYTEPNALWYFNCLTDVGYNAWRWEDINVPIAITMGSGYYDENDNDVFKFNADTLRTEFDYNGDYSIAAVRDANNVEFSFAYDDYGRLKENYANEERLNLYAYHQWDADVSDTYAERTLENYTESYFFSEQGSAHALHSRTYYDPLGRNYNTMSQTTPNYLNLGSNMVHEGMKVYDNWNRVVNSYKPFKIEASSVSFTPRFNTENITSYPQESKSATYEPNVYSRPLKSSTFGESLDVNGHYKSNSYTFVNGNILSLDLSLSEAEKSEMMPDASPASYIFRKITTLDEDLKKVISYITATGQSIATVQYLAAPLEADIDPIEIDKIINVTDGITKVVTLFFYDSQGNLRKVINPKKQSSIFEYNLLGWLYRKITPDDGTSKYMYNRSGQVFLQQDGNGQTNSNNLDQGYLRQFEYDIFGRLLKQSKINIITGTEFYNPLRYADNVCNVNNSNDYVFHFFNTMDFTFKYYVACNPNSLNAYNPSDALNGPTRKIEKEFRYHSIVQQSEIANVSLQTFLSNNDQHGLKGKLSKSISYNNTGIPIEVCVYSYNANGLPEWEAHQFSSTGSFSSGVAAIISYPSYNLIGSLKEENVDVLNISGNDIAYNYKFDDLNRLSEVKVNSDKIASYSYDDALGLLKQTNYYSIPPCWSIDNIIYQYDIRNRLINIEGHFFQEQLYYDNNKPQTALDPFKVQAGKNFNGNINAIKATYTLNGANNYSSIEQTNMYGSDLIYGYTYDGLNRLITADASSMDNLSGMQSGVPEAKYGDENYAYDLIGNIAKLNRYDYYLPGTSNSSNDHDFWNYAYESGKNHLSTITESSSNIGSYSYDKNGNMRTDSRRNIINGTYGRGNMMFSMTKNNLHELSYLYNNSDNRIYKKDYINEGDLFIENEEYYLTDFTGLQLGILDLKISSWNWYVFGKDRIARMDGSHIQYYEYDHLGNTRVAFTSTDPDCDGSLPTDYEILNLLDYYPYGQVLRSFVPDGDDRYLTTQHERDKETGLDYFGARYYDGSVGRFLTLDPMSLSFSNLSGYNISICNPVNFIDPNGMDTTLLDYTDVNHTDTKTTSILPGGENVSYVQRDDGATNINGSNYAIYDGPQQPKHSYQNNWFGNITIYSTLGLKATVQEPGKLKMVYPITGITTRIKFNNDQMEIQHASLNYKNIYFSSGNGYFEARWMPGETDLYNGEYLPARALITLIPGLFKLQQETAMDQGKSLTLGLRGVAEMPVPFLSSGPISVHGEATIGIRGEPGINFIMFLAMMRMATPIPH